MEVLKIIITIYLISCLVSHAWTRYIRLAIFPDIARKITFYDDSARVALSRFHDRILYRPIHIYLPVINIVFTGINHLYLTWVNSTFRIFREYEFKLDKDPNNPDIKKRFGVVKDVLDGIIKSLKQTK